MNVKAAVLDRYSRGAEEVEPTLCCPVEYDANLLSILPQEIIDKDYGCGDPSRYVREGDTVLDLGSGGGKICYMAAQLVGDAGRVIGVDMNDDMLALARKYQPEMAEKLGNERVRFVKGHIEDLALDVESVDAHLNRTPIHSAADLEAFNAWQTEQRRKNPMIGDESVDLVVSNCVLNLVADEKKTQLIREIYRVLKPGGRVAISDIVADEPIAESLKNNHELWSGCISGAFEEHGFISAFTGVGFVAVTIDKWEHDPWQVIDGTEFRSVTLTAHKGSGEPCLDKGHAVIYRGPFASVTDDEAHVYYRGERMAVCERTFDLLTKGPYRDDFIGIAPTQPGSGTPWCAPAGTRRPAAETKGATHVSGCNTTGCC